MKKLSVNWQICKQNIFILDNDIVKVHWYDLNNQLTIIMSQRSGSEYNYASGRSPSRTEKGGKGEEEKYQHHKQLQTDRNIHEESPTKHDIQFYIRKINRLDVELVQLENQLSVAKFKLSKAEDFELKYDLLFKENQKTLSDNLDYKDQNQRLRRQVERLRVQQDQSSLLIKNLKSEVDHEKKSNEDLRNKKEELRHKASNDGIEQRQAAKEAHLREIDNLKKQSRDIQEKLQRENSELRSLISSKETIEGALNFKLEKIKKEKNDEIQRLKELTSTLKGQLTENNQQRQEKVLSNRTLLIEETEDRINNVRNLASLIEAALIEEIRNLNTTLTNKNNQIQFLIACDKKELNDHDLKENSFKELVKRLEDKIFIIQRENQIELFNTINRLQSQYEENLQAFNQDFDGVRKTHLSQVHSLQTEILNLKKQIGLLDSENKLLEEQHKKLSLDKEHSVNMLSQKIISMETSKDEDLRNYTTSMKQIESDAKVKIQDLHASIANKDTEVQILQSQNNLKNQEISHLLDELSKLRTLNREKLKKMETTNVAEQDSLNNEISGYKRDILELKRKIHELESEMADSQAQSSLKLQLMSEDLQSQKEGNELLKARNNFLGEWCSELERDLKAERVSNVNILHDQNISHRQNIQVREEVRVELEAIKNKEVEQIRHISKLEKARLESDLIKKEHDLREKKEELARLLVQFKHLESKVGKTTKLDKGSEEEGKCRATLEAEILLTENIFNLINRP